MKIAGAAARLKPGPHAGFALLLLLGAPSSAWACSNDYGRNQRIEFSFAQAQIAIHNDLPVGSVIAGGNGPQRTLWVLRNCAGRQLTRTPAHNVSAGVAYTYKIPGINGIGFRVYGPYGPPAKPVPRTTNLQANYTISGAVQWRMELVKTGAFDSTSITIPSGKYASMDLSGFGNIAGFFLPRNITISSAAKPCTVSSSGNLQIDLGRVGVSSLQANGASGDWKNGQAKIVVTSCPAGTRWLTVRFSGEADARDGSLFKNVGGSAGNVAIRFGHQGVRAVSPGASSSVAVQGGRAEMPLSAQLVSTGGATAGSVLGRVTATMTYQ